jgi:uncharacterized cupredoxin-like copper-binding protein
LEHTKAFGRRSLAGLALLGASAGSAWAQTGQQGGGDLSRQTPIEVTVTLGTPDHHHFEPAQLRFRTGLLYRLVLRNLSHAPHYFTSEGLAASVWTRKAQVMGRNAAGQPIVLAEIKGALREIEVYPGQTAEWWFVPVQAGRFTDLRCDIRAADGRTHAEHGMRGEVVIESRLSLAQPAA